MGQTPQDRAIHANKKRRKVTLDEFFDIVEKLQNSGDAKSGMTSQQIIDIHNKKTGENLTLGGRSGDLNPQFKNFKTDAERIKANKERFGR